MHFVHTERAPAAIGPYSQAIVAGEFVYTAGQISLDPDTGKLVEGSIEEQTRRVLRNIKAILEAADTTPDAIVKTVVFLSDLGDFAGMNAVYAEFFGEHKPARSTVEVAALPKGVRVEIEAIAFLG